MAQPPILPASVAEPCMPPPRRSWRGTLGKLAFSLVFFLTLGETTCRLFWKFERGAPFWSSQCLWEAFYPQFRATGVDDRPIRDDDDTYDVLILGGSTISPQFGSIGQQLQDKLEPRLKRPVRVYNLAFAAHNSRDSLMKMRRLSHQRFDLVVVYDGINDTRMNNAPTEVFREDYAHGSWYKHLNWLHEHPFLARLTLPFTLIYLTDRVAEASKLAWFLPRLNPDPSTTQYGQDLRTPGPFGRHLKEIAQRARQQGSQVLLMTFAVHLGEGATYAGGRGGVELWGQSDHVTAAVERQNEAVRDLVRRHPDYLFVDQAERMPASAELFHDCCHFTEAGCVRFVDHLLEKLP